MNFKRKLDLRSWLPFKQLYIVLNFRDNNNNTGVLEILNSSYLDFDDPISKIEMNIL